VAELGELVPGAEIVPVSARTGEGIEALRSALAQSAERVDKRRTAGGGGGGNGRDGGGGEPAEYQEPVLHVDRVFTVAGHGTVVTGTLWSGVLRKGDRVVVLPGGEAARIRSIESHDRSHDTVGPRRRVALNLGGLRREDVGRGDVVTVAEAALAPTYRLDVALDPGAGAVLGERRVQVHHGTRESPARVVDLGDGIAQLRLEQPLLARRDERVVIRRIAPPDTLGGAVVVDPSPRRHSHRSEVSDEPLGSPATEMCGAPDPPEPGPLALRLLAELEGDQERPRTPAKLAEDLAAERREVERAIGELVDAGLAVRFKADVVYPAAEAERLGTAAAELATRAGSTSIGEVRDALGLSRKYAQALLEHLDGERVLRRDGDRHHPRRPAS
jgi:selenocysteine-specific elongation factor